MFKKSEIKRLCPLLIFWAAYTAVFFIWVKTFLYTLPFLLGLLIAVAVQPVISFLEKKFRFGHTLSTAAVVTAVMLAILAALIFLGIFAVREITELIRHASSTDFSEFSKPVSDFLNSLGAYFQQFDLSILQQNKDEILSVLQNSMDVIIKFFGTILRLLTSLPTLVTMLIVTAFAAFFISKDLPRLRAWLKNTLSSTVIFHVKSAAEGTEDMGRKYLMSYIFLYFLTFCEAAVTLSILGLRYPLTTAIVTACADILPVLGPGAVFVPIAVYQLLIGEFATAFGLLIAWGVITLIRQIIEPQLVSSTVKIHPLAMLAAIYFSLVGKSVWLLIYVAGFFALYSVFKGTGALPEIIKNNKQKSSA